MADIKKDVLLRLLIDAEKAGNDTEKLLALLREVRKALDEIAKASPAALRDLDRAIRDATKGTMGLSAATEKLANTYKDAGKAADDMGKKAAPSFEAQAGSMDDMTRRLRLLEKELKATAEVVDGKTNPAYERLKREYSEVGQAIRRQKDDLRQSTLAAGVAEDSIEGLRAQLRALNRELDRTSKADPKFGELTQRTRALSDEVKTLEAASGRAQRNVGNYGSALAGIGKAIPALGAAFAIDAVVDKVGQAIRSTIEVGKRFEASISNLSAITGATGRDLEYLREQAKRLGSTTTQSAAEVAEAFKLLASAKPELLTNAEALVAVTEATILLAEASGLQVPEAANALTTALNQFKLPASEAANVVNALAAGAKFGSAEIPELADAMKKFGPVAESAGVSLTQAVAAVETLGESKFQAEIAGNALKNIFIKLQKEGIGVTEKGTLDLGAALEQLGPRVKDVTYLSGLFGLENVAAAQALIKGRDTYLDFTEKITAAGNVAAEQARINNDNLQGDVKRLRNVIEGIQINFYEEFSGDLRGATQAFTGFLSYLGEGFKAGVDAVKAPFKEMYATVSGVVKQLGDIFRPVLELFGDAGKDMNVFTLILQGVGKAFEYVIGPVKRMFQSIGLALTVVQKIRDAFVAWGERVQDFIDRSPNLKAVLTAIGDAVSYVYDAVLRTVQGFKDMVDSASSFIGFGPVFADVDPTVDRLSALRHEFGNLDGALERLRKQYGQTAETMEAFKKAFDRSLIEGKSFAESVQIVNDEFVKFFTAREEEAKKRQDAEKAIEEERLAAAKAAAEERKKQREEEQKALEQAIENLRQQAKRERELLLEKSLDGLGVLRESRKKELQEQKGFAQISAAEQKTLLDQIDREINDKRDALLNANAEREKARREKLLQETLDGMKMARDLALIQLEQADLEARMMLGEMEQAALEEAGNNLKRRAQVEKDFQQKRVDLQRQAAADKLAIEMKEVQDTLMVADLTAEQRMATEARLLELQKQAYDAEVQLTTEAEQKKRDEIEKTAQARRDLVKNLGEAVNNIAALYAQDADIEIARIKSRTAANEEEQKRLDALAAREEARKQRALEVSRKVAAAQALIDNVTITINSIKAITEGAKVPFPGNLVAIASIVAAVAAGIANIRALVSSPVKFEDGGTVPGPAGIAQGPSHAQGGIPGVVRTTGQPIEFEGGEFIVRKAAVTPDTIPLLEKLNAGTGYLPKVPRLPQNMFRDGGMVGRPSPLQATALPQQEITVRAVVVASELHAVEEAEARRQAKGSMSGVS